MTSISRIVLLACCYITALFAEDLPVLHIGTESFNPPFVMQGSKKEIYGFDIDMMNSLCKTMNRTCRYHIMRFSDLLDAVAKRQLDIAISSITITPERMRVVNFSKPYFLSNSRFLTNPSNKDPFSLSALNGKKIGIESGTIFSDQINSIGIKDAQIKSYTTVSDQLTGLSKNQVDIILLDNPTAMYWASNSSATFKLMGPPYTYGYGLGIAVNPADPKLLADINEALDRYQNSDLFKQNYNRYLQEF